jgi:hypothetical protein
MVPKNSGSDGECIAAKKNGGLRVISAAVGVLKNQHLVQHFRKKKKKKKKKKIATNNADFDFLHIKTFQSTTKKKINIIPD